MTLVALQNITRLVARLREFQAKKRTDLCALRPAEACMLYELRDNLSGLSSQEIHFEHQSAFIDLLRTYITRRLILVNDHDHHCFIRKEEARIDNALRHLVNKHPIILAPTRSLTKYLAA